MIIKFVVVAAIVLAVGLYAWYASKKAPVIEEAVPEETPPPYEEVVSGAIIVEPETVTEVQEDTNVSKEILDSPLKEPRRKRKYNRKPKKGNDKTVTRSNV